MTALVLSVIAASRRSGFILNVTSSTSTKTGVAPQKLMASVVAINVLGTVMTFAYADAAVATDTEHHVVGTSIAAKDSDNQVWVDLY